MQVAVDTNITVVHDVINVGKDRPQLALHGEVAKSGPSLYFEKPYYVIPDGDEAEEGYAVIREALRQPRASSVAT